MFVEKPDDYSLACSPDNGPRPDWVWFSQAKPVPDRLAKALRPRKSRVVAAANPAEYLLEARQNPTPQGEILVIDGSEGQADMIQLWLRHLRRDQRTSAAPILVWSHTGRMTEFDTLHEFFRLSPDGIIGRRGWKGSPDWIDRVESVLNFRVKRQFHIDVHLDMASRAEALERTAAWIQGCAEMVPWMKDRQNQLRQAIFELGQNAIEWGNNADPAKLVHMRLRSDDRCLHFSVTDQGKGFNPQHLPHAAAEEDPIRHLEVREQLGLREGGFGLLITRGLVDRMAYNATGNAVRVTMRHNDMAEGQPPPIG